MPRTLLPDVEQRTTPVTATDFVVRAAATDDADPVFTGHAAVFNTRTSIGNPLSWGFYEEVAPGAFSKTLAEGDARFLVDHDTARIIARVTAGDLRLAEDDIGLAVDADLDQKLDEARNLTRNLEKRRITGMSFGFQVVKDDWTTEEVETKDGDSIEVEVRVIQEVRLFEVSAVTFPAYEETDAALRAIRSRSNPDPLGRRGRLLERLDEVTDREPGGSTRGDKADQPAVSTGLTVARADLDLQALAARYRLPL